MAVYTTRTVVENTFEVALPSPCPWVEVSKAMAAVKHRLEAEGIELTDDAAWLHARDDEVVFTIKLKSAVDVVPK